MSSPTLAIFSATPREIGGGYEVFTRLLLEEALSEGIDARIVTPPASQFRAVTTVLGLRRMFSHLTFDSKGENTEFGRIASHAYVKGELLDLAWWRAAGNRRAIRTVGLHTPLRYPPTTMSIRIRNALYASPLFAQLVGHKAKLHLLSPYQQEFLQHSISGNVRAVIPNGVQVPDALLSRDPSGPLRYAFVGRLSNEKGPDRLAPLLQHEQISDLSVFGDGPLRETLQVSLGKKARFFGHVSRDAVMQALAELDVLLVPSRWESHPFALLEAMAQGCIPVVAALPSLVAVLPPSLQWLAVDFDRPEAVRGTLDRLTATAKDSDAWSGLREESYKRVKERYNAGKQLKTLLDFVLEGER